MRAHSAARHGVARGGHGLAVLVLALAHEPGLDLVRRVDFKVRRLELEVRLGVQQGAPQGGDLVHTGLCPQQAGEPLRRGVLHLALGHFPKLQRVHVGHDLAAARVQVVQPVADLLARGARGVFRPAPRQQARGRQLHFALVAGQQAQTVLRFLQNPGDVGLVVLKELHDTARPGEAGELERF